MTTPLQLIQSRREAANAHAAMVRRHAVELAHPWAASDVTIPEPTTHCEHCGRALYAGVDEWRVDEVPAHFGNNPPEVTTVVTCQRCQEWRP